MKKPEYYIGSNREDDLFCFNKVKGFIEESQRDAYNIAIVDAVKNAVVSTYIRSNIKGSRYKLLECDVPYDILDSITMTKVDKQSILKLLKE